MDLSEVTVVDETRAVAQVRIGLLRGFRVERAGATLPDSVWQRRTAKHLTKLMATLPMHTLHREQIVELFWPNLDPESGRNSFAKALHAARRAFEPDRARGRSAYLHLRDDMLTLDTEHVLIDADQFQWLAERAFRLGTRPAYERALAVYTGELLPEDRYEDWSVARRDHLAELRILLLLGLAEKLEQQAAYGEAADRLRAVLEQDPTREDVHRRLMRLFARNGVRGLAVRQFEICRDVLRRELNMAPDQETEALYRDVCANRFPAPTDGSEPALKVIDPTVLEPAVSATQPPLVGRDGPLELLRQQLSRAEAGRGGTILLSGEVGVGKSRLVAEFLAEARADGFSVLGDENGGYANRLPYAPFALALEGCIARASETEQNTLALRYPALTDLVPSLNPRCPRPAPTVENGDGTVPILTTIARLLGDLARARPVVVVLGDLHGAHSSSIELFGYLATLAPGRRWLIVGTFREEAVDSGSELSRVIEATARTDLSLHIGMQRLARHHCDDLVRTHLPGGVVEAPLLGRIYGLSLGNPLFVEEIIREARARNELALFRGRWRERRPLALKVPARVRSLVEMGVGLLETHVRRLLDLAALNGTEITLAELRLAAAKLHPALAGDDLLDALDRALESGILVERGNGYAFRHPLVRAALYEGLPRHRRFRVNAALGRPTDWSEQNGKGPAR